MKWSVKGHLWLYVVRIPFVSSFLKKLCYWWHLEFSLESSWNQGTWKIKEGETKIKNLDPTLSNSRFPLVLAHQLLPSLQRSSLSLQRKNPWALCPCQGDPRGSGTVGIWSYHWDLTSNIPLLEWVQPVDCIPEPGNAAGPNGGEKYFLWNLQCSHSLWHVGTGFRIWVSRDAWVIHTDTWDFPDLCVHGKASSPHLKLQP